MPTLDLHGAINKYAVYNGASDAPLTNPLSNLGNLLWHSDLPYIGVAQTITGTVNLNPFTAGWSAFPYTKTIAAHGQSYRPIILGHITVSGVNIPIQGSFLANVASADGAYQFNFSSDATNILLKCEALFGNWAANALNCSYTIYVMNIGTNAAGGLVLPTYYNGFEATTTRLRCGYFDTDRRYLVQSASGSIGFPSGATVQAKLGNPRYISGTYQTLCLIYKYLGYTNVGLSADADTGASFVPTAPVRAALK